MKIGEDEVHGVRVLMTGVFILLVTPFAVIVAITRILYNLTMNISDDIEDFMLRDIRRWKREK